MITTENLIRWVTGTGLVALAALAWAVYLPGGFWTAALAASLVGSTVATALVIRSRSVPSPARVNRTAGADRVPATVQRARPGGAALRPEGERKP